MRNENEGEIGYERYDDLDPDFNSNEMSNSYEDLEMNESL